MENASKALIIAGAILLSILIIGLGMFIYQRAADAMEGADLSSEQVNAYNSKFLQYEGTQRGTAVRSLCDVVRNQANTADDNSEKVGITYGGDGSVGVDKSADTGTDKDLELDVTPTDVNNLKAKIYAGKSYDVSFSYAKSGKIKCVIIQDKE